MGQAYLGFVQKWFQVLKYSCLLPILLEVFMSVL